MRRLPRVRGARSVLLRAATRCSGQRGPPRLRRWGTQPCGACVAGLPGCRAAGLPGCWALPAGVPRPDAPPPPHLSQPGTPRAGCGVHAEGAADADATQKKRKLDKAKGAGKTAAKKKSKKSKGDRQKDQGAAAASEDAAGDAAEDTARSIVAAHGADNSAPPATKPTPDMTTIVLFYGYIEPQFSKYQQDDALDVCHVRAFELPCWSNGWESNQGQCPHHANM